MTTVLLLLHLFVTVALIGVVLIQRSEGGGLGIGTSQGMGSFMSGRGTTNLLTRTTAILGTAFFALSLALALLNRGTAGAGRSILDVAPPPSAPASAPVIPAPGGVAPSSSLPVSPGPVSPGPLSPAPVAPVPAPAAPKPGPSVPTQG